jgi:integrative and conjugative element protein (TIGR02256 family)
LLWLRHRRRCVVPVVWIDERLLKPIEAEAARHAPDETGGMLVGYWSESGDAVITGTIEGGPQAVRRPNCFVPDGIWQQERLDEIYIRSGRVHTYLGDWHSHPIGALRPSRRDRDTAKRIAKEKEARAPHPLTVIGSTYDGQWSWAAFCYGRRRGFRELPLRCFDPACRPSGVSDQPAARHASIRDRPGRAK